MTSVRSLLRLLNGNNISLLVLLAVLVLYTASCGATRQPQDDKPATPKTERDRDRTEKQDTVKKPVDTEAMRVKDSLDKLYPVTMKEQYNIAVFLPLYLDEEEREKKYRSAIAVAQDFYKGIMVAADTLEKCGMKLKINVVDSEFPLFSKWSLQDTLKRMQTDLIIGPLLESRIYYIDSIAAAMKINIVSPLMTADMCRGSNYTFESFPAPSATGHSAADFIRSHYPEHKLILINEKNTEANPIAQAFMGNSKPYGVSVVNFDGKGASTYNPELPLAEKNVIFVPSRSEVFVSALMAQLRLKETEENEIIVVGVLPWTMFNTLEGELWEKLNVHLVYPYHIDYESATTQGFLKSFRTRYKDEASLWATIGFDELVTYANLLKQSGKYFQRSFIDKAGISPSLHTTYKIQYDTTCAGWRNMNLHFLEFENYALKKAGY